MLERRSSDAYEILRDHRSHATGATQLRGHDGQVKEGEQKVRHARDSVGQTSGATQRCPIQDSARESGIRDAHDIGTGQPLNRLSATQTCRLD
jgi:hypothetical protein